MNPSVEKMAREAGYASGFTDFGPDGSGAAWIDPKGVMPTLLKSKWSPVLEAFAQAVAKRCAEICATYVVNGGELHPDVPADQVSETFKQVANVGVQYAALAILAEFGIDGAARQEKV